MKKRLVMGTLTAALIAGSVPYEIYAQQEEVTIQSEEEGQEEPAEPEQPEPAPSEEPQPTMEPEPTGMLLANLRQVLYFRCYFHLKSCHSNKLLSF